METIYGIISDIHQAPPQLVGLAVNVLKHEGAQKLVLNGDLVGERFPHLDQQNYAAGVLQVAADSGLEVYAQEGSHEEIKLFEPVIQTLSSQRGNLIDVSKNPKIEEDDHHLIYLAGSDWHAADPENGLYTLSRNGMETGMYTDQDGQPVWFTNIEDVLKYTTEPEKTIVICHVPRKFATEGTADIAYFAENGEGAVMPGVAVEGMIRQQVPNASYADIRLIAANNGFTFKRENRGNADLGAVLDEAGVTKAINGHFHESSHAAHTLEGSKVKEGEFVDELYWNASFLDGMKVGLLKVKDGKVAYHNVELRNYVR